VKWVSLRSKIYVTGLIMGTLAWTASLTPVLSFLSLSLFHVSPLFLLFFSSTLGQRWRFPLSTLFLFFLALHTVSLGMRSRGTFPFGITVEGGKKESADDFERLYERKRTQMKQTGGMERRSTGPSSSFSLTDTSTSFFSICHTPGPCLLATIALQSPLHTVGTGAYTQKQLGRWFSMLPPTPSGPYAHGLLSVLFPWVSQMYTGVVLSFHCRIS
jgi:hypothetical protein